MHNLAEMNADCFKFFIDSFSGFRGREDSSTFRIPRHVSASMSEKLLGWKSASVFLKGAQVGYAQHGTISFHISRLSNVSSARHIANSPI